MNVDRAVHVNSQSNSVLSNAMSDALNTVAKGNNAILSEKLDFALKNTSNFTTTKKVSQMTPRYTAISGHPKFINEKCFNTYLGKSPYEMKNKDQNKYFMSSYKGFVPNMKFLLGSTTAVLTHDALVKFSDDQERWASRYQRPITCTTIGNTKSFNMSAKLEADAGTQKEMSSGCVVYPQTSNMTPNYSGHIPGQKFRFGATFGELTQDVRCLSASRVA